MINKVQTMYANATVLSVETGPGLKDGGMWESSGGGEFKFDTL
jgi:hypothetical protein